MSSFQIFNTEQLDQLEQLVEPELRAWAVDVGLVVGAEPAIRKLAAFAARETAGAAYSDEKSFKTAVGEGRGLTVQYNDLGLKAPLEFAGLAAGRMASARLLATWYDLQPEDFLGDPVLTLDQRSESLNRTVGATPKTLGFVAVSAREVLVKTLFEAQDAVAQHGAAALEPFMEFPQYPRPDWAL